MSVFERYLTVWVFLCIVIGIALGQFLPSAFQVIGSLSVAHVNLPVGILIWVMIIPMLVKVDFGALGQIRRHVKGIGVTLFVNWLVKPFSMALLGWIFIRHVFAPLLPADQLDSYIAGLILLAAAPCTAVEAKKMMEAPDTSTALGYRDRCILEVLYSTGIRRGELNALKVTDLDLDGGFLRVNQGKGGKDRVVPLGRMACRFIRSYLEHVRPLYLRKDPAMPWLFLSRKSGRMSTMVARGVVRRYTQEVGIGKKVTPHTFRHTCATLMLKNGANIRHVQEQLGHASLETTKIYTAVTVTDLKEIHKRCHPRERERRIQ